VSHKASRQDVGDLVRLKLCLINGVTVCEAEGTMLGPALGPTFDNEVVGAVILFEGLKVEELDRVDVKLFVGP
jgi:hypothetical protein